MAGSFKRRAQKGREIMDRVEPTWKDKVDRDRLNMYSEVDCVLGQVYGTFDVGVKHIISWFVKTYPESYPELNDGITAAKGETNTSVTEEEKDSIYKWLTDHGFAFMHDPDERGQYAPARNRLLYKRFEKLTQVWIEELGTDRAV